MTAGVLLAMSIPLESPNAIAQTTPTRTNPRGHTAAPTQSDQFSIQHPVVGSWRGNVHNSHVEGSDDNISIVYELQLSQNGQGSWQIVDIHQTANPDSFTTNASDQGTLTYSIQNNNIVLQLSGGTQPMTLRGEVAEVPNLMAGRVTGTDLFFRFIKN